MPCIYYILFILWFQLEKLEEVFTDSKYPDVYRREEIAAQLDLKEEVVRVSSEMDLTGKSASWWQLSVESTESCHHDADFVFTSSTTRCCGDNRWYYSHNQVGFQWYYNHWKVRKPLEDLALRSWHVSTLKPKQNAFRVIDNMFEHIFINKKIRCGLTKLCIK